MQLLLKLLPEGELPKIPLDESDASDSDDESFVVEEEEEDSSDEGGGRGEVEYESVELVEEVEEVEEEVDDAPVEVAPSLPNAEGSTSTLIPERIPSTSPIPPPSRRQRDSLLPELPPSDRHPSPSSAAPSANTLNPPLSFEGTTGRLAFEGRFLTRPTGADNGDFGDSRRSGRFSSFGRFLSASDFRCITDRHQRNCADDCGRGGALAVSGKLNGFLIEGLIFFLEPTGT